MPTLVLDNKESSNVSKVCLPSCSSILCLPISVKKQSLLFEVKSQRTIGPENAHLKPDLGVLSHH